MKRKLNSDNVPEPAVSDTSETNGTPANTSSQFSSFDLDSRLLQAVHRQRFVTPTSVQSKTIPLAIEGKSILVRAKTGSGKTIAYLLPILHSQLRRRAASTSRNGSKKTTEVLILVPTKELAAQVHTTIGSLTAFCDNEVRTENLSRKEDDAVTRSRLVESPDVVVATPSRAAHWVSGGELLLKDIRHLVVDEADLVLSYGYEDDLRVLAEGLPVGIQTLMMSATLRTEVDILSGLFCRASKPERLDLSREEAAEKATLAHYIVRTAEQDKFLLIYAILKLQLIRGKFIVFVADVDRAYRVRLFLEQFGIRSCVLNSELPVNSRLHTVDEFNRGVYDIIIAADDSDVVGSRTASKSQIAPDVDDEGRVATSDLEEAGESDDEKGAGMAKPAAKGKSKQRGKKGERDPEYGVSRGIDFRAVTCVINFDLPASSKQYVHRVGRTARAGQTGMALSFYVPKSLYRQDKSTSIPQCANDEDVLRRVRRKLEGSETKDGQATMDAPTTTLVSSPTTPKGLQEWAVDWSKLEGLRYRFNDALRSVSRVAIREARTRELRNELINSERLKRHFEENPDDLKHLRHDREVRVARQMPHLKHVPNYLLPGGAKEGLSKDVGFVGLRKMKDNRIRKAREYNKARPKRKSVRGKHLDPLKSLNARGRGKI